LMFSSQLSLIASISENNVISSGTTLPWSNDNDKRRWMDITHGKQVLMGRKSFQAIYDTVGSALPGRTIVVVSSRWIRPVQGMRLESSVTEALEHPEAFDACIYADGRLYREVEDRCDFLYLTRVHERIQGEAMIDFSLEKWKLVKDSVKNFPAADGQPAYSFLDYVRRR
jgi:dihydrofolate reductase